MDFYKFNLREWWPDLMIVTFQDDQVQKWVADQLPYVDEFGPSTSCAAISKEGKMIAGFVFHEYRPNLKTVQISMASINPMWARRENIHQVLSYPFEQLQVFKLWIATMHTNVKMLKAASHIGFRKEAILAHQYGIKRHAVIMRMLQPDYMRLFGGCYEKQAICA